MRGTSLVSCRRSRRVTTQFPTTVLQVLTADFVHVGSVAHPAGLRGLSSVFVPKAA